MEDQKVYKVQHLQWFKPILEALKELSGSASVKEVKAQIQKDLNLSDEFVNQIYGKNKINKFNHQINFASCYLGYAGYLIKNGHGTWTLTDAGREVVMTDELANQIYKVETKKHVHRQKYFDENIDMLMQFYETSFLEHWDTEKFKWEAVKCFQDNWDIDSPDFVEMLRTSLNIASSKMLNMQGSYAGGQIIDYAKEDSEQTKLMFKILYDENLPIEQRIQKFKDMSQTILENHNLKYPNIYWKTNFQNEYVISVYLWLRYPDNYYIFKLKIAQKMEEYLVDNRQIKKGNGIQNFLRTQELYKSLTEKLKQNDKLVSQLKEKLSDTCYEDPDLITLTIDLCYHYEKYFDLSENNDELDSDNNKTNYWIYSPGEQAKFWEDFHKKGIAAYGWGKLGDASHFFNKKEIKSKMQSISGTNDNYMHDATAVYDFANNIKVGDIIFAKKGRKIIIGRGEVTEAYSYDATMKDDYCHIVKVKWSEPCELDAPKLLQMKTLTNISDDIELVEKLNNLFNLDQEQNTKPNTIFAPYDEEDFLTDVFMSDEKYNTIKKLLERKKNIILQGAPGVGKTFAAKRLAYSMLGEKDIDHVKMIQFHQSYSYEDFIMGYRPLENGGFERKSGVFYDFCKMAEEDIDENSKYFFIIDEINRGNMSKIFGELMMLIENDKRGQKLQLLYANELFSVPKNVYIIGLMNTADRSLAMIDYALRRRFAFVEFEPGFETQGFIKRMDSISNPKYKSLIEAVIKLNKVIENDLSLGKGFRIGHSYFVVNEEDYDKVTDNFLFDIIEYEIKPLLEEYWFDEPEKLQTQIKLLEDSIR